MHTPNVTLASGRVVVHTPAPNGAQFVEMEDEGNMSEAEWEEYCALRVALASRNTYAEGRE